nr:MAG TPA: tetramerization motif protein [Caudoviricetes sp.]
MHGNPKEKVNAIVSYRPTLRVRGRELYSVLHRRNG